MDSIEAVYYSVEIGLKKDRVSPKRFINYKTGDTL
jgi:hypothetical protein